VRHTKGRFTSRVGEYAGKYVKNEYYNDGEAQAFCDVEIAIRLKEENKAFKVEIRAQLLLENRQAYFVLSTRFLVY
jgi:hypothetical protein